MDYCIDGNEKEVEKAILHLYKKNLFTDVTVKYNPGNIKFYVHKLILSLYSPVLCDIFYGKSQCHTLDFEGIELSAVKTMISFCYGEQLIFRNINQIRDTHVIAVKYQISELYKICLKEIDSVEVDTSNVLTLLEMCIQNGKKEKEKECLQFIGRNQETVFKSELFMKMKFENICPIFNNLREMGSLTDVQYLRSALEWMACNDTECKEKLLNRIKISKLSIDEFIGIIISFPTFFSNIEIAKVFQKIKEKADCKNRTTKVMEERNHAAGEPESTDKEIKQTYKTEEETPETLEVSPEHSHISAVSETAVEDVGPEDSLNLQDIKETYKSEKKIPEVIPEQSHTSAESETADKAVGAEDSSNLQITETSNLEGIVVITISDGKEDVKQAVVTFEDGIARRGHRFYITGDLKDGLFLDLISRGNGDYTFYKNLTYDSVYFLLSYLNSGKQMLSPLNYIEVLKAAFHFGIQKVKTSCLVELNNIIDFDPAFLDGLLQFTVFEEKVTSLLISNTNNIILHPNFINCSVKLIKILLSQKKLNVSLEIELLIVTISWLEARNRLNWAKRCYLLNEIAFENVKSSDVVYALKRYPSFFTETECRFMLFYKFTKKMADKKFLPKWYNFKSREYSNSYVEEEQMSYASRLFRRFDGILYQRE